MAYELKWRRKHPGHLVYLVDLSGSMGRKAGDGRMIDIVLDALRKLFNNLVSQCEAGNDVLNYFSVSVYGYNSDVIELLKVPDSASFADFVDNCEVRGYLFDTTGEAKPQWQTYMADAFNKAASDVTEWIASRRNAGTEIPAPVVINITDGYPEEKGGSETARARAIEAAKKLREITTPDGNVQLFNVHFSPDTNKPTLALPSSQPSDADTRFLYEISSPIPAKGVETARNIWPDANVNSASRMMISNEKNPRALLSFIDFGSTVSMNPDASAPAETPKPE